MDEQTIIHGDASLVRTGTHYLVTVGWETLYSGEDEAAAVDAFRQAMKSWEQRKVALAKDFHLYYASGTDAQRVEGFDSVDEASLRVAELNRDAPLRFAHLRMKQGGRIIDLLSV